MSRSSLGVVLVALGTPRARRDIRMCGFSSTASLDEVCRTLAATGMYSAETLRIDALRALGKYIEKHFKDARESARWMKNQNRRLGVWAATSCAREALRFVPKDNDRSRVAVETTEAWVRGNATRQQVMLAADDQAICYIPAVDSAIEAAWFAATAAADAATIYYGVDTQAIVYSVLHAARASPEFVDTVFGAEKIQH